MTFKGFIRNRQQANGILGLLLIVLSLTGLLGCPSPTPSAESKKAITGTLSYNAIGTTVGIAKTQDPSWTNRDDSAQTVIYSIAPANDGISIDESTGVVSIAGTAPTESSGEYTVTATGTGNYGGDDITGTITVTIQDANTTSITGTLSYEAIKTEVGIAKTQTPSWSGDHNTAQTVTYSIAPTKDGISIDQATGEVTVAGNAPTTSSGAYTVTAKGTGDYGGDDITTTIAVTIQNADATSITGTLSYDTNIDTTFGTAKTQAATWTNRDNTGQTVTYSIAPTKQGISIDQATGEVTVAGTAPTTSSGAYTVTATGYGDYKDSITADITITIAKKAITGALSYDAIETAVGTLKTLAATWTGENSGQTVTYSIAPAKDGISIDQATGEVTVAGNAPTTSSGAYTVTATGKGAFQGTETATIQITITVAKDIKGKLSYYDLTIAAGSTGNKYPNWIEHDPGQLANSNISYSIAPPDGNAGAGTGVTINAHDGIITVSASATPASSGTYTVTAKGIGAFQGTITGKIKITINAEAIPIGGSFSYDDLTIAAGNTDTVYGNRPLWAEVKNPDQKIYGNIQYSITSPDGNAGTGVTINANEGIIIVSASAPVASSGTYTVTAKGAKTFKGTITGTIKITIGAVAIPIIGSFSYDDITMAAGVIELRRLKWSGHHPNQTILGSIRYSIEPPDGNAGTGVTINAQDGTISVSSSTPVASSGTYTVTAKGAQAFEGTIKTTVKITINAERSPITGKFAYDDITIAAGNIGSKFPNWSEHDPAQLASSNISYSIAPPDGNAGTGVMIDPLVGFVDVLSSAPVASSGTYTVTAKGARNFEGTITTTIKITINAEAIPITGKFAYDDLTTAAGNRKLGGLVWSEHNPDQTIPGNIQYSIAPPDGNAGTGVTINGRDGNIIVGSLTPVASSGTYTVTATGAKVFKGTITTTIKITINAEAIPITGKFTYEDLTVVAGVGGFQYPEWSEHNPNQLIDNNIEYSFTPPDGNDATGVIIYWSNGAIYISASAPAASSGTYTVTATGAKVFKGTITSEIKITITE